MTIGDTLGIKEKYSDTFMNYNDVIEIRIGYNLIECPTCKTTY